jgi:hypothetical protein
MRKGRWVSTALFAVPSPSPGTALGGRPRLRYIRGTSSRGHSDANGPAMNRQSLLPALAVLLPLVLAACANSTPVSDSEYNTEYNRGSQSSLSSSGGALFTVGRNDQANGAGGGRDQGGVLGVNAYLWRGALDTLSFMPLASADPFGGVIITDWYQPPTSTGERFKATAYILGRQLRADGVRVSIFRQVQQNGQWVDAPTNPGTGTEIENKVLARARELRSASAGG